MVTIEFADEGSALAFELYQKSGFGRAFAKRNTIGKATVSSSNQNARVAMTSQPPSETRHQFPGSNGVFGPGLKRTGPIRRYVARAR